MASVIIDRDSCISCGLCWSTCPDVFEQNLDDGLSQILTSLQQNGNLGEAAIADDVRECAQQAADACPVSAISVV